MKIKMITNEEALQFLRAHKAHKEVVFIRPCDIWWGAYIDGKLAGVTGIVKSATYIKLDGSFVAPTMRRKGVATALLEQVLELTAGHKLISYSRPEKARINKKFGFKTKRILVNKTEYQELINE